MRVFCGIQFSGMFASVTVLGEVIATSGGPILLQNPIRVMEMLGQSKNSKGELDFVNHLQVGDIQFCPIPSPHRMDIFPAHFAIVMITEQETHPAYQTYQKSLTELRLKAQGIVLPK